jgi:hypothetical protein
MSGGDDKLERELESFLGDDSRVAALYRRLPKDEPDSRLDAAVLAKARAAVAPRRTRSRWLPAMSAAAALVVAAGLAYRVGPHVWNERSADSEKAEQSVSAPTAQKPAADVAAQPAPVNEPEPQAETNVTPSLRSAPAAGSAMGKVDADRERHEEKAAGGLRKQEEQKSATAGYAAQSAQNKPLQAAGKESARDSAAAASASSNAAQVQSELRMNSSASPPRIDAAPASPSESAVAAPEPLPAAKAAPESADKRQASPMAFPRGYAPAAPPPVAAASAPARKVAPKPAPSAADIEVNLYPEHWISDIQKMIKDGHRDDAIKNLVAFRKRYPTYKLPDDLRDLK